MAMVLVGVNTMVYWAVVLATAVDRVTVGWLTSAAAGAAITRLMPSSSTRANKTLNIFLFIYFYFLPEIFFFIRNGPLNTSPIVTTSLCINLDIFTPEHRSPPVKSHPNPPSSSGFLFSAYNPD
jgi:hypothetical protein